MKEKKKIDLVMCLFGAVMYCLLTSCNSKKVGLEIGLREVKVIYTKPGVISNYDSLTKYPSNIYFGMSVNIKNNSNEERLIKLNDLRDNEEGLGFFLIRNKKTITFYNYSFSNIAYPGESVFVLKANDSVLINLESPYYYSNKKSQLRIVDSIFKDLVAYHFVVKQNKLVIDSKDMDVKFMTVPVDY